MFTTREQTMIAKAAASAAAIGVPIHIWFPPGITIVRLP